MVALIFWLMPCLKRLLKSSLKSSLYIARHSCWPFSGSLPSASGSRFVFLKASTKTHNWMSWWSVKYSRAMHLRTLCSTMRTISASSTLLKKSTWQLCVLKSSNASTWSLGWSENDCKQFRKKATSLAVKKACSCSHWCMMNQAQPWEPNHHVRAARLQLRCLRRNDQRSNHQAIARKAGRSEFQRRDQQTRWSPSATRPDRWASNERRMTIACLESPHLTPFRPNLPVLLSSSIRVRMLERLAQAQIAHLTLPSDSTMDKDRLLTFKAITESWNIW